MCGICGVLGATIEGAALRRATDTLLHRGPDEAGYFQDNDVALGMRRLSIIDLGGGTQPKCDESGRIQVIFNGEIYNYRELQAELRALGHRFTSNSDTEVIAHAYAQWGTASFDRLNGIFAIAVWHTERRELVLARDHLGVKPLYYALSANRLVFGSELKPIVSLLGFRPPIDRESLALYLRYRYVPEPRSIYEHVYKLPPAHYLVARPGAADVSVQRYWDPLEAARSKRFDLTGNAAEEAV